MKGIFHHANIINAEHAFRRHDATLRNLVWFCYFEKDFREARTRFYGKPDGPDGDITLERDIAIGEVLLRHIEAQQAEKEPGSFVTYPGHPRPPVAYSLDRPVRCTFIGTLYSDQSGAE